MKQNRRTKFLNSCTLVLLCCKGRRLAETSSFSELDETVQVPHVDGNVSECMKIKSTLRLKTAILSAIKYNAY